MMARAVPRMPAPTIKTSDSWSSTRRRAVGDTSGHWINLGDGGEESEVGGLGEDGGGVSCI